MRREVTFDNFPQVFREYVLGERRDDLERSRSRYPYRTDVDVDRFNYEMLILWFSYGTDPVTGTAPLDDFVDKYVRDEFLAAAIRVMKMGIIDEFDLLERRKDGLFAARARSDGRTYILSLGPAVEGRIDIAKSFAGWIHRLDSGPYILNEMAITDSTHRIIGMDDLIHEYVEYRERAGSESRESRIKKSARKTESAPISPETKILTELNRLPAVMVNLVWESLGIKERCGTKREKARAISSALTSERLREVVDGLPEDGRACLQFIVNSGWVAEHADLRKRFGADDTVKRILKGGPQSTIGILRAKGLLFVGMRKNIRGWYRVDNIPVFRKRKIAVIPLDIRSRLSGCGFVYGAGAGTAAPAGKQRNISAEPRGAA